MRADLDLQAPHYFACLGFQPQSCSAPDFCQSSAAGLLPSTSTDAAYLDLLWTDAGRAWVSAAQQSSAHGEYQVGNPLLLYPASLARGKPSARKQSSPQRPLVWLHVQRLPAAGLKQTSSRLTVGESDIQLLSRQAAV